MQAVRLNVLSGNFLQGSIHVRSHYAFRLQKLGLTPSFWRRISIQETSDTIYLADDTHLVSLCLQRRS